MKEKVKVYRIIFDGQVEPAYFSVDQKGIAAMNEYYFKQIPLFAHPIVDEITLPPLREVLV